jgi:hypothetical protein
LATTWAPIFAGPSFADRKGPAHEQLAVKLLDRRLGTRTVGVFDESESARAPGLAIERPDDLGGVAHRREVRP